MSNPQDKDRLEELAALNALDLLDNASLQELLVAARSDRETAELVRDFNETAALLAHEASAKTPPPELRAQILRALPSRQGAAKIFSFTQLFPYAIAACLMALAISEAVQIVRLKKTLAVTSLDAQKLRESNELMGLRVAVLEAKDAAYSTSQVTVAWDPYQHRGLVSLRDLPPPPAGKDYQLWLLDPNAAGPISAGMITGAKPFETPQVSVSSPGFAITLEPAGGSPAPTSPILFAVSPGS